MSDIFREIDEEVRRERLVKLWKAYGVYIVATAVLLIAIVAGRGLWSEWQDRRAKQDSAVYMAAATAAAQATPGMAAEQYAAVIAELGPGYATLARLREGSARLEAGDTTGAVAAYDALAADSGAEQGLRDLARLLAAMAVFDTGSEEDVRARLTPLAQAGNLWFYSANELLALLDYRAGDLTAARDGFATLVDDPAAPAGLRGRAGEMLSLIEEAIGPAVQPEAPTEAPAAGDGADMATDGESAVDSGGGR